MTIVLSKIYKYYLWTTPLYQTGGGEDSFNKPILENHNYWDSNFIWQFFLIVLLTISVIASEKSDYSIWIWV